MNSKCVRAYKNTAVTLRRSAKRMVAEFAAKVRALAERFLHFRTTAFVPANSSHNSRQVELVASLKGKLYYPIMTDVLEFLPKSIVASPTIKECNRSRDNG
ncbi:hypothetical protein B5X24_HaOG201748 [Helicoverpa armigera]|nr:hypothetical protein B5X24_HaOG201748 [Helicoverpa armigera]